MKLNKTIIFLLVLLGSIAFSCLDQQNNIDDEDSRLERESEMKFKNLNEEDAEIIEIDGCEYILYQHSVPGSNHGYGYMAHKGNCNNPIHIYNKLPESLPVDSSLTE